jgi:hypothetical protein
VLLSHIPEERRRRIFLALVTAQDDGLGVLRSRMEVAAQFRISCWQVERIEEEGLHHEWPPLSEGEATLAATEGATEVTVVLPAA